MNPDPDQDTNSHLQSSPRSDLPDPKTVLRDPALTREERIAKLLRWRHDAEEIETANNEGMRGIVRPSNLSLVLAVLRELEAEGGAQATDS